MEKIIWNEEHCIGVSEIDEWQEKMIVSLNDLFELRNNDAEPKDLIESLIEVTETARYLFSTEEKVLTKHKYPDRKSHQKKHKVFIKKTALMRRMLSDETTDMSDVDFAGLSKWSTDHIAKSNKKYAPFIRINMTLEKQRVAGRRR